MKKIRSFIAIPLPEHVQTYLGSVGDMWAEQVPAQSVRWVKPHLMHATLRFLGDTEATLLPRVAALLDEVALAHESFSLALDHPGCFPNTKRPRVVWIGLQGQLETAHRLKAAIDQALVLLGWEAEDRSFSPHLTIGRVQDSRQVQGFRWEAAVEPLAIPVQSVQLIESDLQRSGPVYTVRHTSALRTA